jgi:hypothetical protein
LVPRVRANSDAWIESTLDNGRFAWAKDTSLECGEIGENLCSEDCIT